MKRRLRFGLVLATVLGLVLTSTSASAAPDQSASSQTNYYQTFTTFDGVLHCRAGRGFVENNWNENPNKVLVVGVTYALRDAYCANQETVPAGTLAMNVSIYRYPNILCAGTGWKVQNQAGRSWAVVFGGMQGSFGQIYTVAPGLGRPDITITWPGYDVRECGGHGWYYARVEHLSEFWGYGQEWTGAVEAG